jgi:hypothetical protein
MQLGLGSSLPAMLNRLGMRSVGNEGISRIVFGGEPYARFTSDTVALFEPALRESGGVTEADLNARREALADPTFTFVSLLTISTWGRREDR